MTIDPLSLLSKRISYRSLVLFPMLMLYIAFSVAFFFQWVNPSLDGRTDQHIAADSTTYIYFADSLREGRNNPYVMGALYSFPNTLWAPVLLALALKSTFATMVVNYALFFIAIVLFKKSFSFSSAIFIGLLLLNPTTTISLLSVNKEIIDLLAISLFFYSRRNHHKAALLLSLLLALLNRYELCIVMLFFLFAKSKLNPWRERRVATVAILVIALDLLLPFLAQKALAARFEEATGGGIIVWLDSMEMHYLYAIAVIPKIAENLFGEILNFSNWKSYNSSDLANSYILWFNNLANAIVLVVLATKHRLAARSDLVYFAMIGVSLMAVSLVIQPRYFYFVYVLLCLQAALSSIPQNKSLVSLIRDEGAVTDARV